jgi:hypothetical protein
MDISNMGAPHMLNDRWIDSGFGLLLDTKAFFAPARANPKPTHAYQFLDTLVARHPPSKVPQSLHLQSCHRLAD